MKKSDLSEFEIQDQEFKLRIKRDVPGRAAAPAPAAAPVAAAPVAAAPAALAADPNMKVITSPMVGTYYATPSPDSPNFVAVGSPVKADSVVCIIEAMKLFNEIESEIKGKVVKVLVEDASPVEYDQPLFLVEPF